MRAASLFSGVGGLDLGLERAGIRVVSQCEKDPWRRRVLAAHWPGVPCAEDVTDVGLGLRRREPQWLGGNPGRGPDAASRNAPDGVDLLPGGFPCQDLSVAGRRAGLVNGTRSNLFFEYARIAAELQPRWLLVENVPGLLSSADGRDFAVVLSTLADLGYGLAWRILDARYFGVPQRRRRVFIVGCAGGDPEPALRALGQGRDGDPAAGVCSWQRTPAGARARAAITGRDPRRDHAACLTSNERWDLDTETFITHALTSEGHDASEDGTGRGTPLVVSALQVPNGRGWRAGVNEPGRRQEDDTNLVAFYDTGGAQQGFWADDGVSPTLKVGTGVGAPAGIGITAPTGVRRLTPTECERLMSWPDNWTNPEGNAPDSRRYAACGDGVVSNVSEWIGRRIIALSAITALTPETE